MTPAVLGGVVGALAGLGAGLAGAKAINAGLDRQMMRASPEDARTFVTIRRLAGPIVVATTIVEIAVVGYVAVRLVAG